MRGFPPFFLAALVALGAALPLRAGGIPEWLPKYDLDMELSVEQRKITVHQRITWTNRHSRPAEDLVLNVYPRYKIPDADVPLLAKTLELLRAPPSEAIDGEGRRLQIVRVTTPPVLPLRRGGQGGGVELPFAFRDDMQTALVVRLPKTVRQGETATVEIDFALDLPEKQGRWGHWKGVTFLANWHPVLAYYDDDGWQPTPFIPWHQPFFNEAGVYDVRLTLPADQRVASTGSIVSEKDAGDGCKLLHIKSSAARDFALVCSNRFEEWSAVADHVKVRVLALPEHGYLAQKALEYACEVIPLYNRWFGPYPFEEFDVVESYFPWNGNECSGMIMLDHRVLGLPRMGEMYVDHMVSHETLHQWWYNVVGTDGYRETWMDEGVVTFYTAKRFTQKYGKNASILRYPNGFQWLPKIRYDDYRFAGLYGTIERGESTATVQPVDQFGNVVTLFSMTYERGGKVMGMIEERLGEAAFFEFMKQVHKKYRFRILRVADFQRELEAYTGQSWDEFFQNWLYSPGMSDWAIENVEGNPSYLASLLNFSSSRQPVIVTLRQKAEFAEPTVLGVKLKEGGQYDLRIPVHAGASIEEPSQYRVEPQPDGSMKVTLWLCDSPAQISVDPDQVLLDREPANNHWTPETHGEFTYPSDLTTPYDRWSFIVGPWFDERGHVGLHAGPYRLQQFRAGVYAAYDTEDEDLVAGVDAVIEHWPFPYGQVGFQFDHSLTRDWQDTLRNQARLFSRYVFNYTPSLYLDPMQYLEVYARWEEAFWRGPNFRARLQPGVERYDDLAGVGIRYHRDFMTPYWDAEAGYRLDMNVEHGMAILGADESYERAEGEFAVVKGLPEGLGYFSETRLAARVYGGMGLPDNGEHFQLGGQSRLRGLDRIDRQGSAVWIASLEWRLPIWRDVDYGVCDDVVRLRHLYGAALYDVGDIYLNGHTIDGVAHSVGFGLRFDVAWFSFVERTTFRFDVAKVVNDNTPVQFWFGLKHAF